MAGWRRMEGDGGGMDGGMEVETVNKYLLTFHGEMDARMEGLGEWMDGWMEGDGRGGAWRDGGRKC